MGKIEMASRQEQILSVVGEETEAYLSSILAGLTQRLEDQMEIISSCFQTALQASFDQVKTCPKKGKIEYICISYLLSSLYTESFDFKIDFYNSDFYLDERECESYFSLPQCFDYAGDFAFIKKTMQKKLIRVMDYEVWTQVYLFQVSRLKALKSLITTLVESMDFSLYASFLSKTAQVIYGEYMGSGELIMDYGQLQIKAED